MLFSLLFLFTSCSLHCIWQFVSLDSVQFCLFFLIACIIHTHIIPFASFIFVEIKGHQWSRQPKTGHKIDCMTDLLSTFGMNLCPLVYVPPFVSLPFFWIVSWNWRQHPIKVCVGRSCSLLRGSLFCNFSFWVVFFFFISRHLCQYSLPSLFFLLFRVLWVRTVCSSSFTCRT